MTAGNDALLGDHRGGVRRLGVLLDQDRVGAGGNRRASGDADRLAGAVRSGEPVAGGGHADELQPGGQGGDIGGAHRVTVHGGGREGRTVAIGHQWVGKHPAGGLGDGDGLDVERHNACDDARDGIAYGKQPAHQPASGRRQVPDRPPRFSSKRMPVISMPRSTALAMS